tara:strand:- start:2397 stop:3053 length:657 start_codon:yes stop_codon:yes gene_type:complete
MAIRKYYNKYKKIKKKKIKDDSILERIENILKIPFIYGSTKQFLDSVYEQCNKNGGVTEAQLKAIKKIEDKYSKETFLDYEKWKEQYDSEKKEVAKICAFYYKNNPPYFKDLSEKILSDSNFIPTEKQFNSMCKNKFTQKVIEQTRAIPKFEAGQLVQGRKNAPLKIRDCYFSVIEVGAKPVISSARGAKIYTLLPLGKTQIVECEERFLKKMKKNAR